jgi:hypothetical protein
MIDDNLLSHARNLARQVAPELFQRRPCYICCSSLFEGLPVATNALGCCFDGRVTFYDFAERIPNWTRPGPVVVLFGDAIAEDCPPECYQDAVLSVVLHELAHALPAREDIPEQDHAEVFDCQLVRDWQAKKRQEADSLPDPQPGTPEDFHGIRFVRTAVHLLGRASLRGWQISPYHLFGGSLWYLSQPPHYVLPLMKEIVDHRNDTFTQILATRPPAEFTRMWEHAFSYHVRRETSIGAKTNDLDNPRPKNR